MTLKIIHSKHIMLCCHQKHYYLTPSASENNIHIMTGIKICEAFGIRLGGLAYVVYPYEAK